MSCNSDGRHSQPAADLVGGGDTELVQMTGRRGGGNCSTCGQFLPATGDHRCPPRLAAMNTTVETAFQAAVQADERRPFIVVEGLESYFPLEDDCLETGLVELRRISQNGGAATLYRYDETVQDDLRRPAAIYLDGKPEFISDQAQPAAERLEWAGLGQTVHALMDCLHIQSEIPTAGEPARLFERLDVRVEDEQLQRTLAVTRETVAARADTESGFTAQDAAPLWAAYTAELERRIEREAGPAMAAIDRETGRDYYDRLNRLAQDIFGLPGEIGLMWDETGFGGNSELVYLHQLADPDNPEMEQRIARYSLPDPADPETFIAGLGRIARREAGPETVVEAGTLTAEGHHWGPANDQFDEEEQ